MYMRSPCPSSLTFFLYLFLCRVCTWEGYFLGSHVALLAAYRNGRGAWRISGPHTSAVSPDFCFRAELRRFKPKESRIWAQFNETVVQVCLDAAIEPWELRKTALNNASKSNVKDDQGSYRRKSDSLHSIEPGAAECSSGGVLA